MLSDRLDRASRSLEGARVRTAGPMISREELRWAVRELADAVEDLSAVVSVLYVDSVTEPDDGA
jgi:hypothetical protein